VEIVATPAIPGAIFFDHRIFVLVTGRYVETSAVTAIREVA
jgi:hypothetical protein